MSAKKVHERESKEYAIRHTKRSQNHCTSFGMLKLVLGGANGQDPVAKTKTLKSTERKQS